MRRSLALVLGAVVLALAATASTNAHSAQGQVKARRVWHLDIGAPATLDYTLAQASFRAPSRGHPRLSLTGPIGADYVVAGSFTEGARLKVMLFILNRATDLMDPASIGVALALPSPHGRPKTLVLIDGLAKHPVTPKPALCDLPLRGHALEGGALHTLLAAGAPLEGFSSAEVIAQAYDISCGLPFQSAFEQALTGTAPTPSPPTPSPSPPQPPHCEPCQEPPGYACPLRARMAICVAQASAVRPTR